MWHYGQSGNFAKTIVSPTSQRLDVCGICVSCDKEILILCRGTSSIYRFTAVNGTYIGCISNVMRYVGPINWQLSSIGGMAVDPTDERLFVATLGYGVQVFCKKY